MDDCTGNNRSRWLAGPVGRLTVGALLLVVVALAGSGCKLGEASGASEGGTAEAVIGDMVITVTDGGTLRAAESVDIISRVESNATVLWLVDEIGRASCRERV